MAGDSPGGTIAQDSGQSSWHERSLNSYLPGCRRLSYPYSMRTLGSGSHRSHRTVII